ncbi:MAG: flagellar assembly peptidoglycan hydrolase FlgJ [Methylophilaceae bacterium]
MALETLANQLAINPQALDQVKLQAKKQDTHDGIKTAARQFEAYFLQLMLKTMRDSVPKDGLFDNEETKSFTEMFDQQMAQTVSQGKGLGMADALLAQIERSLPKAAGGISVSQPTAYDIPMSAKATTGLMSGVLAANPVAASISNEFIQKMQPYATAAAKTLGVPTETLLAQAAVESGWGKKELKTADGGNSYNVFNVKAGTQWTGPTTVKDVNEYMHGRMVKSSEKFRVYGSYDEAFADYAKLISGNSRYAKALNQDAAGFVNGLQQGGFATDPNYASKIMGVANSNSFRDLFKLNALQGAIG